MITPSQLQAGIVIPVDKPRQWTSFQAVNKIKATIRKVLSQLPTANCQLPTKDATQNSVSQLSTANCQLPTKFKIGHAGTLDPLASGLLLVCVGKATKTIPQLQDGDKIYTGTIVFGATTPCYDLERPVDHYYPYEHITPELLDETVRQFTGTILQVPPMFSAVKIAGQRAYDLARSEVGRMRYEEAASDLQPPTSDLIKPKPVNVYSFEITAFRYARSEVGGMRYEADDSELQPKQTSDLRPPTSHLYQNPLGSVPPHLPQADFRIHCGKGTYIRSLARDLGQALGSGAFLSSLRREKIGDYTINQAIKLDDIQQFLTSL